MIKLNCKKITSPNIKTKISSICNISLSGFAKSHFILHSFSEGLSCHTPGVYQSSDITKEWYKYITEGMTVKFINETFQSGY